MAVPVRQRLLRLLCLMVGGIGALMLVPVGVVAAVYGLSAAFGHRQIGDPVLADWVFLLVHSCFAVWGFALSVLTPAYWSATRRPCRAGGRGHRG